jgi:hypothetical protein
LTKAEKLLSNLRLKNKQCIRKIKTSNTTILKKRQEYNILKTNMVKLVTELIVGKQNSSA